MKNMVVYIEPSIYITAVEGTGDNLLPEDIADGYNDYVMTNVYEQDGADLNEIDGGQMLSQTMIADLDDDEIARRLLDYWGYEDKQYQILGVIEK